MEAWEKFLRKLIQPTVTEIHLARGREIKSLLETLSKYPFHPIKKIKNIKEDADLVREEIRGAVQRYIYGHFVDSIIWSCFSVEFGLIVKLNEILSDVEKKVVPKPFTLGRIIRWASAFSILDDKSLKAAREIQKLRNIHIHGSNFIAALILSYRSNLKMAGVDIDTIKQGLDLFQAVIPKDALRSLLIGYDPPEIIEAFKTIQSLSTFEWCADEGAISSMKREVDRVITDVRSSFLSGHLEEIQKYSQDYILHERALRALKNAQIVLESIGIL